MNSIKETKLKGRRAERKKTQKIKNLN